MTSRSSNVVTIFIGPHRYIEYLSYFKFIDFLLKMSLYGKCKTFIMVNKIIIDETFIPFVLTSTTNTRVVSFLVLF